MNLVHNALVAVADGQKMLFFRNQGDAQHPHLVVEYGEEQKNPADRDQKSDAQGSDLPAIRRGRRLLRKPIITGSRKTGSRPTRQRN